MTNDNLHKYRNQNYRNTEIQTAKVRIYKLQDYRNAHVTCHISHVTC